MSTLGTKDRIVSAAQELFAEKGFTATSMREITTRADVNLAAINYHFGSKENLLREVVRQCIAPINIERMIALDKLEAAARATGTPLDLRDVVQAFLEPAVRLFTSSEGGMMPCMLARLHHEPHSGIDSLIAEIIHPVMQRFVAATQSTLPNRVPKEIILRGHFMIGSLLHLMDTSPEFIKTISGDLIDMNDSDYLLEQLVNFCTGGFRHA